MRRTLLSTVSVGIAVAVLGGTAAADQPAVADDHFVQCEGDHEFADAADLAPIAATAPAERELYANLHRFAFERTCHDDGWTQPIAHCFAAAHDAASVKRCEKQLPKDVTAALAAKVAEVDALAAKAITARAQAAGVGCARVADEHYRAAVATAELPRLDPKLRQRLMDDSRRAMVAACTADGWSELLRACVLVDGSLAKCTGTYDVEDRWGFPAFGVSAPTGVASCDQGVSLLIRSSACVREPFLQSGYLFIAATILHGIGQVDLDAPTAASRAARASLEDTCRADLASRAAEAKEHGCPAP